MLFHAESVHSAFLSTPSVRRATLSSIVKLPPHIISIHALREEGDRHRAPCSGILPISIHALREEGDQVGQTGLVGDHDFYPRPP